MKRTALCIALSLLGLADANAQLCFDFVGLDDALELNLVTAGDETVLFGTWHNWDGAGSVASGVGYRSGNTATLCPGDVVNGGMPLCFHIDVGAPTPTFDLVQNDATGGVILFRDNARGMRIPGPCNTVPTGRPLALPENLLVNGGAETGDLTGWTVDGNGYQVDSDVIERKQECFFFWGGVGGGGAQTNEVQQTINVTSFPIDDGGCSALISGWRYSASDGVQTDRANVILDSLDEKAFVLDTFDLGELISPTNVWVPFAEAVPLVSDTRFLRYRVISQRDVGESTDGFHDSLALRVVCTN